MNLVIRLTKVVINHASHRALSSYGVQRYRAHLSDLIPALRWCSWRSTIEGTFEQCSSSPMVVFDGCFYDAGHTRAALSMSSPAVILKWPMILCIHCGSTFLTGLDLWALTELRLRRREEGGLKRAEVKYTPGGRNGCGCGL